MVSLSTILEVFFFAVVNYMALLFYHVYFIECRVKLIRDTKLFREKE